jgi:hypothetical protein
MPAILAVLIPELIQLGVQLPTLIDALRQTEAKLAQPDPHRPDVSDAQLAEVRQAIVALQARIDAA